MRAMNSKCLQGRATANCTIFGKRRPCSTIRSAETETMTLTAQPRLPQDTGAILNVYPAQYTKTIHFIRHGQAWSNVAGAKSHDEYAKEEWFDASLSEDGWKQVDALSAHIQAIGLRPELVVVSPLTRALQTASGAFGTGSHDSGDGVLPLMQPYSHIPDHQVGRPAISSKGAPPFLAHELCRETLGIHPCDRRRDTAHYKKMFPAVDFSLITDETDTLWLPDERENRDAIKARGVQFLSWLMTRPEREIAVVAHSGFLHACLLNFAHHPGMPEEVVAEYIRWFENCELRTITVIDPTTKPAPLPTNFPGGTQALDMANNS